MCGALALLCCILAMKLRLCSVCANEVELTVGALESVSVSPSVGNEGCAVSDSRLECVGCLNGCGGVSGSRLPGNLTALARVVT